MEKSVFLAALIIATPVSLMAQDDLYFSPGKSNAESKAGNVVLEKPTYYCGSDRDVDEYNRHGKFSSYYQKIGEDSLGNDIIEFHVGDGSYSEAVQSDTACYYDDDDFVYSRRLSHFDCWYGCYWPCRYGYWSPWRYRWGWYDPWYDWCWGYGYWGWYDWYYGWGYPYYHSWWGRPIVAYRGGHTGTLGYYDRNYGRRPAGNTGTARSSGSAAKRNTNSNAGYGTRRSATRNYNNSSYNINRNTGSYSNSRGSSFGGNRGGSFGGGSFGGGSRGGHSGGRR